MKHFYVWAIAASALYAMQALADTPAVKVDPARGQQIATQVCAACHGADGNSSMATYPRLAGLPAAYISHQLAAFKSGARKNPVMAGMAAGLSPEDMNNLGAWFASQTPKSDVARLDAKGLTLAQSLWRGGNAEDHVPACAACHGPAGAGIPDEFPRLAGQHPEYVAAQLKAFRSGERAGTEQAQIMSQVAAKLSDEEIAVVSQYVAGLH